MGEDTEKLAEEHAEWCAQFLKWVYKQAFIHGVRHGKEIAMRCFSAFSEEEIGEYAKANAGTIKEIDSVIRCIKKQKQVKGECGRN